MKLTREEALWIKNDLQAAKENVNHSSSKGTLAVGGGAVAAGDGDGKATTTRRKAPRKVIPAGAAAAVASGSSAPTSRGPAAAPLNEYELEREVSWLRLLPSFFSSTLNNTQHNTSTYAHKHT
jgi:hypothetical protein